MLKNPIQNYWEYLLINIGKHYEKMLEIIIAIALYKVQPVLAVCYTVTLIIGIFSTKLLNFHIKNKII